MPQFDFPKKVGEEKMFDSAADRKRAIEKIFPWEAYFLDQGLC